MKQKTQRPPDVGGQAVLEGVMMRTPDAIAIAVRKPDGSICIKHNLYESPSKKHKWMGLPIIRGAISMVTMLKLGIQVLTESGEMSGIMDEEPSKFEKWLSRRLGKGVEKIVMGMAALLAVALSVGLFVLLPNIPAKALRAAGWSLFSVNLVSGFVRTIILIGYLIFCGMIPDMHRVFQYHGAEHKAVYCHENKLPMTVANVQKFSTLHPRCGTSFLLITFIFSILFYSVIDVMVFSATGFDMGHSYLARVLSRLVLLPLVAGVSYELLKSLAHAENGFAKALRWPGMQLQRLTTRPPTDEMCEVAIASIGAALNGLPQGERTPEGYALVAKDAGLPDQEEVAAGQTA